MGNIPARKERDTGVHYTPFQALESLYQSLQDSTKTPVSASEVQL